MTSHGFANPECLVNPNWLQTHLEDSDVVVVVVDVEAEAEAGYLRGHIPGAIRLLNNYERDPGTGLVDTFPPERVAATCEALGIGDVTTVVVYDNNMVYTLPDFGGY